MGKFFKFFGFCLAAVTCLHAEYGEPVRVSGSISQSFIKSFENDYLIPESSVGSFEISEVLLNIQKPMTNELHLGMQFIARDFGDEGNLNVELDWAFIDYRYNEFLGTRVGRFKLPQGLYNEVRDLDIVRDEVMLPQSVYPEDVRAIVSGVNGVNWYGSLGPLDFQNYFGNMNIGEDIPFVRFMGEQFNSERTSLENRWVGGTSATLWLFESMMRLNYNYMHFDGFISIRGDDIGIDAGAGTFVEVGPVKTIRQAYDLKVDVQVAGVEFVGEDWTLAIEGKLQNFNFQPGRNFLNAIKDTIGAQTLSTFPSLLTEENAWNAVKQNFTNEVNEEFWGWYIKGSYRVLMNLALTAGYGETSLGGIQPEDYRNYQKDGYLGFNYNFSANIALKGEAHGMIGSYYADPIDQMGQPEKYGHYYILRGTYAF